MRRNELTTATSEPGEDAAIQVVVTLPVRPRRREGGQPGSASNPALLGVPRITRLMALAIKFQDMVEGGEVRDYADLARLGYVTRARLTQIMNLLLLAPEIQEEILLMKGNRQVSIGESHLRPIVRIALWVDQKREWRERNLLSLQQGSASL